jgi:hypothetical protein
MFNNKNNKRISNINTKLSFSKMKETKVVVKQEQMNRVHFYISYNINNMF